MFAQDRGFAKRIRQLNLPPRVHRCAATLADSPDGELRVWPLQLIFYNVGWYFLFEIEESVGFKAERLSPVSSRSCDPTTA